MRKEVKSKRGRGRGQSWEERVKYKGKKLCQNTKMVRRNVKMRVERLNCEFEVKKGGGLALIIIITRIDVGKSKWEI